MSLFLARFSLRMGQFSNPVATHPRTNEVEVPPRVFATVEQIWREKMSEKPHSARLLR